MSSPKVVDSIPVINDCFTADPAPLVVGDTLYLFVGHDEWYDGQEAIDYAMATSIDGPWTHCGQLKASETNSFTIHPGIAFFQDEWYLFYHNAALTIDGHAGAIGRRSVCVAPIQYDAQGRLSSKSTAQASN